MDGQYRYYIDNRYLTAPEMDARYGGERAAVLRAELDKYGTSRGTFSPELDLPDLNQRFGLTNGPVVPRDMRGGSWLTGSDTIMRDAGFPDRAGLRGNPSPMMEVPMSQAPTKPPANVAEMMALFARGLG